MIDLLYILLVFMAIPAVEFVGSGVTLRVGAYFLFVGVVAEQDPHASRLKGVLRRVLIVATGVLLSVIGLFFGVDFVLRLLTVVSSSH